MVVTEIIHFSSEPSPHTQAPNTTVDDTIQKVVRALKRVKTPAHFVLGTQIQDKSAVQITAEWDDVQDFSNFEATPEFHSFVNGVRSFYGEPHNVIHIALDQSTFGPGGAATANVVEFVQSYFPASRVTPEFQKQIEDDYFRFHEIFSKGAKGNVGRAFGWGLEEQEHEDIKGEKAKCFFVITGWESMGHFEQSVQTDDFKNAIPILFAWNSPFKMWHVERNVLDGLKAVA